MLNVLLATLLLSAGALQAKADTTYTYKAKCFSEVAFTYLEDLCTIVDTRTPNGALKSRGIFSNRFGLSIKSRFDPVRGFVTWDSLSNQEYQWSYQAEPGEAETAYSRVMPRFLVEGIPWD